MVVSTQDITASSHEKSPVLSRYSSSEIIVSSDLFSRLAQDRLSFPLWSFKQAGLLFLCKLLLWWSCFPACDCLHTLSLSPSSKLLCGRGTYRSISLEIPSCTQKWHWLDKDILQNDRRILLTCLDFDSLFAAVQLKMLQDTYKHSSSELVAG